MQATKLSLRPHDNRMPATIDSFIVQSQGLWHHCLSGH